MEGKGSIYDLNTAILSHLPPQVVMLTTRFIVREAISLFTLEKE
jgi:hypothetical protein